MTYFETSRLNKTSLLENAVIYMKSSADHLLDNVKKLMSNIILINKADIDIMKKKVWDDLSAVYYKYDGEDQKRAFREVIKEIAEKIYEDKWNTIYKKIY